MRSMVSWLEFPCSKCKTVVKPGNKIYLDGGKVYCGRCGRNKALAAEHRFVSKVVKETVGRMANI